MIGELNEGVGLVVCQPDVVPGRQPLDEVRFEQERLGLGVGDGDLDPVRSFDHARDPGTTGIGVRPDAIAKRDGFADVAGAVALAELVDAGLVGEVARTLADCRRVHRDGVGRGSA